MPNSALLTCQDPSEHAIVSVVTTMHYSVAKSGECTPLGENHSALHADIIEYDDITHSGAIQPPILKRDTDLYGWRDYTDIVVQGNIRCDAPAHSLTISLSCISSRTRFAVDILATGDRRIESGPSGVRLTDPVPFTEMPMRYDRAYGGVDELAEARHISPEELAFLRVVSGQLDERTTSDYAYPRNPAGRGYLIEPDGVRGLRWPNLEFPGDQLNINRLAAPMNQWGNRPYPACFDWFSHSWFPRVAYMGVLPDSSDGRLPEAEVRLGLLKADIVPLHPLQRIHRHFSQAAHPYLWRHRLLGDEEVRITHMSSDGRDFIARLPNAPPRIFIKQFSGRESQAVAMLDCIFVETDLNRISLVWRGSLPAVQPHLPRGWGRFCSSRVVW